TAGATAGGAATAPAGGTTLGSSSGAAATAAGHQAPRIERKQQANTVRHATAVTPPWKSKVRRSATRVARRPYRRRPATGNRQQATGNRQPAKPEEGMSDGNQAN